MSIPVALDDLASTLADFGPGYLLTVSVREGVGPKAVSVRPRLADGVLHLAGPGRGSVANASEYAAVTLLFPPVAEGGHSLIVDGTATADGEDLRVTPTSAILHRPADHG